MIVEKIYMDVLSIGILCLIALEVYTFEAVEATILSQCITLI